MQELASRATDISWLREQTLDELGTALEWSIHGWMHLRWSGAPHDDSFSSVVDNDWLFVPWSSHVNKHFWKLHGWIDERISDWEVATGQNADLSNAWSGPSSGMGGMRHSANIELLSHVPPREALPLPMEARTHIIEGLLKK